MYSSVVLCFASNLFSSYYNSTTGQYIDYYEIEVKPFEQQVYPGLKKAQLVGYDGISPGPTFRMEKDREAVVRFVNRATTDLSVHLHGSYSEFGFTPLILK
jgi:bilirubin oxidase